MYYLLYVIINVQFINNEIASDIDTDGENIAVVNLRAIMPPPRIALAGKRYSGRKKLSANAPAIRRPDSGCKKGNRQAPGHYSRHREKVPRGNGIGWPFTASSKYSI